ncbi:DnaA ATPase domain-containing protein [Polycladidibacter stylochi]|uniref:DnaA ATPase domain-containing protein n=1 Tax=Polycladidibacter stylochi TaxID=1807766 RepID=UPI000830ACF8|nr:DnaA/Hda family protein [Pseudovibrio stylochi]
MNETANPQQLPLVLPHEEALGADDYLVTDTNQAAYKLVTSWPEWPSPIVMVNGPAGSGKSHLVSAWSEISGANICQAKELTPQLLPELVEAGPVAIEDLHEGFDERNMFHLFNAVRQQNSFMLLTSRKPAAALNIQVPDLSSRFRATTPVEIHEPDDMLLKMVMTKLFADRQVAVDSTLIDYLVLRIERSLYAARNVVELLDRQALASGTKITRVMASRLLENLNE